MKCSNTKTNFNKNFKELFPSNVFWISQFSKQDKYNLSNSQINPIIENNYNSIYVSTTVCLCGMEGGVSRGKKRKIKELLIHDQSLNKRPILFFKWKVFMKYLTAFFYGLLKKVKSKLPWFYQAIKRILCMCSKCSADASRNKINQSHLVFFYSWT